LSVPRLATAASSIIVGSKPNGMPPGLALHAELRALAASGLSGEQILHAAGRNAAIVLGLENQVGTITPGALADLVLVNGDPLEKVNDALNIVAVVRNGRLFSLVNLLERAAVAPNVE
jgi:imidazolonepropionase-like amidohydrolase